MLILPSNSMSLMISGSFREGKSSSQRWTLVRPSMDIDDFLYLFHGSDSVKVDLNRLENEVRDKDRELSEAQAKIKALKLSERLREKAVEELTEELSKVEEKLKLIESLLEHKNLEIKEINDEKKASMAAQFAAHATQKDDDKPPIEDILAPLEAELKLARQEITKLQDDNKALDRLTKSKDAALVVAERTVQSVLAKTSMWMIYRTKIKS
ncbi:Microtubule-associated protein 70-4, partial [Cucurbita argyrosperma subsp. sororia]